MRVLIGLSALWMIGAAASCAKPPLETQTRAPEPSFDTTPVEVAPIAPVAVEPPENPSPIAPPRAPPPPDDDDRGRGRLPSSRVDGGGSPKPMPPGVQMDASPL
jgi:hypothetical protein